MRRVFSLIFLLFVLFSCSPEGDNPLDTDDGPTITILSPFDNYTFYFGDDILFDFSIDGAVLDISDVLWESDIDEFIGDEDEITFSDLSPGQHKITISVTFSDGNQISAEITIFVLERNLNAVLTIIQPDEEYNWYYSNETGRFSCQVRDSSNNPITFQSAQWNSKTDGMVSSSRFLYINQLSQNNHDLELIITFNDDSISKDTLFDISIVDDPYAGTGLYNDKQLSTEADPNAPYVRDSWKEWIYQNNTPIRSLTSENFSDLTFLDDYIGSRSIVAMGEVAHGILEQNKIRARIIKYLHQNLGFNLIVFESGFYECYFTNLELQNIDAETALKNSLYGFWRTFEILDLFEYIKESKNGSNPINIAGMDLQPTGNLRDERPQFFRNIIEPVDPVFAQTIFETDTEFIQMSYLYDEFKIWAQQNYSTLSSSYDNLILLIENNQALLTQQFGIEIYRGALESAKATRNYLSFRNSEYGSSPLGTINARDLYMFENVDKFRNEFYPESKMIIWAHNCHIEQNCREILSVAGGNAYLVMLGDMMNYTYGDDYYSIVSFGYRGTIDYGTVPELEITTPESIEAILYNTLRNHCFVELNSTIYQTGNEWIFQYTQQMYIHGSAGTYMIRYKPADQFDAVIFIDRLSKPTYIY